MTTRILFNQILNPVRTTGVEAELGNAPLFILSASIEVIVSAGAIQSPQLLMVSGIRLPSLLQKCNISTIVDSPGISQNL
jgi:choline dehydrogenase